MHEPTVLVRDKETNHTYKVSEERYRRTPDLWERLGSDPAKPKTSVAEAAAKKKAASPAESKTSDATAPDEKAGSTATQKEN